MLNQVASSAEDLTFCTLFDMDDTCIKTDNDKVKNPHLLLPIMLFQTHTSNQFFAICTNRAPTELEGCYPVPDFIEDLAKYGIRISMDNVTYGGGQNNQKFTEGYRKLQLLMQGLSEQLEAIELTQTADHIKEGLSKIKELCLADERSAAHEDAKMNDLSFLGAQIERAGYYGKNFHINQFLKSKYDSQREIFQFDGHVCTKKQLVVGMVDDKIEIAGEDIIAPLGLSHYFGIKASRGGKPPKDHQSKEDYYQDDYLFKLGVKIGLMDLAHDLLKSSERAQNPMQAMAVMLFAWHAFPQECSVQKHIKPIFKALSPQECQQVVAMLDYICKYANTHQDAHYHPMDEILACALTFDHEHFLEGALARLKVIREELDIERQTLALKQLTLSSSESNLLEAEAKAKKSKFKFSLKKSASTKSKSGMMPEEDLPVMVASDRQIALEKEEAMICARVLKLRKYPLMDIAQKAKQVHKVIEPSAWVAATSYSTKESFSAVTSEEDTSSSESPSLLLVRHPKGRARSSRSRPPSVRSSEYSSSGAASSSGRSSIEENGKTSNTVVIGKKNRKNQSKHNK